MDLPGYDFWKTTPPDDAPCDCRAEDCEACERIRVAQDAFDRMVDRQIDEDEERRWDR